MKRHSVVAAALSVVIFGSAGEVRAATCNVISQDTEINFTLTRGNPAKVVDQACVGGGREAKKIIDANDIFGTRGWAAAVNTRTGEGNSGFTASPNRTARSRGAAPRARSGGSGSLASFGAAGQSPSEEPGAILWSTSGQLYRDCDAPDFTAAGILAEGDENACPYNDADGAIASFAQDEDDNPPAVPLPAAGGMLIVALGGLVLSRRRRKA